MNKPGRLLIVVFTLTQALILACKPKANTSGNLRDAGVTSCKTDADLTKYIKDRDQAIADLKSRGYNTAGMGESQFQGPSAPDANFGLTQPNCDEVSRIKRMNCAATECAERNKKAIFFTEDCSDPNIPVSIACAQAGGVAYNVCIEQNKANVNNNSTTLCCAYKMGVSNAYVYNWLTQENAASNGFTVVPNSCQTIAAGGNITGLPTSRCQELAQAMIKDSNQSQTSKNQEQHALDQRDKDIARFKANYDKTMANITACQKQIADYQAAQNKSKAKSRDVDDQKPDEQVKPANTDPNEANCLEGRANWARDLNGKCVSTLAKCPQAQWTYGVDGICRPYYKCSADEYLDGYNNCKKKDPSKAVVCKDDEYQRSDGSCVNKDTWNDSITDTGFVDQDEDNIPDYQDRCPGTAKGKNVWTYGLYMGCAEGEATKK